MRNDPDALFARFLASGEPEALARLFDRTAPELLAVARHLAADLAEAEDLVQATFLAAIEGAGRYDPERPVLPWLAGILTRQAGLARRARRRPEAERLPERREPEPAERLEREELASAVRRAVQDLPPPYDEVLALHLAEGERPQEIAARLGRAPGTVRVQLHRGLTLLRRALPAGLAAGGTASAATHGAGARGLAALRSELVRRACASPASGVPVGAGAGLLSSSLGAALGGALVTKLLATAAVVTLALGLVALLARSGGEPAPASRVAASAPPAVAQPLPSPPLPEAEAPPLEVAREAVEAPRDAAQADAGARPARELPLRAGDHGVKGRVLAARTGTPVAGARVYVFLAGPADREVPTAERVVALESGADGRFSADGLALRPEACQVQAEGFAPFAGSAANVPGLRAAGALVDLGDLSLPEGVRLSGRVLDSATGAGVARARLFLARRPPESFSRRNDGYAWEVGRSDEAGRFELPDRLPHTGEGRFGDVLIAVADSGLGWTGFELLEGSPDEREVDVVVGPQASLSVRVLAPDGRPAASATVSAWPLFDPFAHLSSDEGHWTGLGGPALERFRGRTDGEGVHLFAPLPLADAGTPSAYRVEARGPGPDGAEVVARARVELGGAALFVATLRLGSASTRVVSGSVRDASGAPVAGASVRGDTGGAAECDAAGRFRLELAEPLEEETVVRATAEGFAPAERRVRLDDPAAASACDLVLARALAIAGRVVDPAGEPVVRAHVGGSAMEVDDEGVRASLFGHLTDPDGRFRFDEVPEGRWRLLVSPPYGEPGWLGMQHVVVPAGAEDLVLELPRAPVGEARLVVRVRDAVTRRPLDLDDVHVTSRSPFSPARDQIVLGARRVAGGAVVEDLRPGAWRVWVRAGERVPGHADFDVRGKEELEVEIELGGPGSLAGVVRGIDDAVGPLTVWARLPDAPNAPSYGAWASEVPHQAVAESGEDGSFRVAALKAGRYLLHAEAFPYVAEGEVLVRAGAEARVELHAAEGAWLTLEGPAPAEEGWIEVLLTDTRTGRTAPLAYARREAERFVTGVRVLPGLLAWEVRFRPEDVPSTTPARRAGGEIRVEPGASARAWVELP